MNGKQEELPFSIVGESQVVIIVLVLATESLESLALKHFRILRFLMEVSASPPNTFEGTSPMSGNAGQAISSRAISTT
jgi:hypothetical protein